MTILRNIIKAIFDAIGGRPLSNEELGTKLDALTEKTEEHLDWRNSIVDLMKLTGQDSSLEARKELASEMGYPGPFDGSADMNVWLHARVMQKLKTTLKE